MARVTYVKKAQPRFEMKTVLNDDGSPKQTPVMKNGVQRTKKDGTLIFRTVTVADKDKPLPNLKCEKCGTEIKVGDPYKWVQTKTTYGGIKHVRCDTCPVWQPSELSSSKMATIYAEQESFSTDDLDCVEDLEAARDEFAAVVAGVRDEYQESLTNIEEHFTESQMGEELNEKIEQLESWIDEIEGTEFDEAPSCEVCTGEGTIECTECDGRGKTKAAEDDTDADDAGEVDCPACDGTGKVECEEEGCEEGTITEGHEQWDDYIQEQRDKLQEQVDSSPF